MCFPSDFEQKNIAAPLRKEIYRQINFLFSQLALYLYSFLSYFLKVSFFALRKECKCHVLNRSDIYLPSRNNMDYSLKSFFVNSSRKTKVYLAGILSLKTLACDDLSFV